MKNKQIPLFKALGLGLLVLWVDFFCGFGGTTEGIERAEVNSKVIGCVNHDEVAIDLHQKNHPDCLHIREDIRDIEAVIGQLSKVVTEWRRRYPNAKLALWFSPDCTSHSDAKGGHSRDPDSRSLANTIPDYQRALNPDYIFLENVKEFLKWGDVRLKEGKGSDEKQCELAVDKKGEYIFVPDKKYETIMYRAWRDKLMYAGYKHQHRLLNVADFGLRTSRLRYWGVYAKCGLPIRFPKATHDKLGRFGLRRWLPARPFLDLEDKGESIFAKPRAKKSLLRILKGLKINVYKNSHFMTGYYGNGKAHSIDDPVNTLTPKDRYALHYIQYDYSNVCSTAIDQPVGAFTNNPKHRVMTVEWLMDFQFGRVSHSVDEPVFTLIARQDKKPPYVLQAELGYPENFIKETDCEVAREIKEFMIAHGIKDVFIRMLSINEQLRLQSFGDEYIIDGATATQAKKFIGNSVPPDMAKILAETLFHTLNDPKYTPVLYLYPNSKIKRRLERIAA